MLYRPVLAGALTYQGGNKRHGHTPISTSAKESESPTREWPYVIEIPGTYGRIYCTVEELQGLADQLNDELDSIIQ